MISNNMFCAMRLGSLELFGPMVLGDTFNTIVPITKIDQYIYGLSPLEQHHKIDKKNINMM
jgi:hypothetical protein